MEYDKTDMPAKYDAGRSYSPRALQAWLAVIANVVRGQDIDHILDLGCGTGRHSLALAEHFSAKVTGVDPSEKMLAEALKKAGDGVHFMRGSAEAIPLPDGSVDMVFMSMVLHHFSDPRGAARECHRVLRDRGMICLRGGAGDRVEAYPYVRFFPETLPLLRAKLVPVAAAEAIFASAGFDLASHQIVESEIAASWQEFADKIAYRADSFLAQLPDAEFQRGLAALRDYAQYAQGPVIEPVDFFAFTRFA